MSPRGRRCRLPFGTSSTRTSRRGRRYLWLIGDGQGHGQGQGQRLRDDGQGSSDQYLDEGLEASGKLGGAVAMQAAEEVQI